MTTSLSARNAPHTRSRTYRFVQALLEPADIQLNGDRPWDLRLNDERALGRALAYGSLGLGEAYMDGDWYAENLDEFFCRLLRSRIDDEVQPLRLALHALRARCFNLQTPRRAWQVGERHYDLGNDFYRAMLDRRMTYTCGYWRQAEDLDASQEAKLDLVCRKLGLQPGMRVLDIGCGWGSFMRYAAEHYGARCVGVTISKQQTELGRELCKGLPVEFRLADYRELNEPFDRVVSIGMFEHVGSRNYRSYMNVAHRCLRDDGLFLLHTIGKLQTNTPPDAWSTRYIFPNGELPSLTQLGKATEGRFVVEDLHNFGADYDRTLMAWCRNFEREWPRFRDTYGTRFKRMWRYYLLSFAGSFRARTLQLWQLVLSKDGVVGGYSRVS